MAKYRTKPCEIEAITFKELQDYWMQIGQPASFMYKNQKIFYPAHTSFIISTLEGEMRMDNNSMLVTGLKGEIYPVRLDIFNLKYDLIQD